MPVLGCLHSLGLMSGSVDDQTSPCGSLGRYEFIAIQWQFYTSGSPRQQCRSQSGSSEAGILLRNVLSVGEDLLNTDLALYSTFSEQAGLSPWRM